MKPPKAKPGELQEWVENLFKKLPTDDCIEWPFRTMHWGRPAINIKGKMTRISHIALNRTGHPRPPFPNDNACHTCDNGKCCNPKHLYWGSKGRNRLDQVERSPTILTEEARQKISVSTTESNRRRRGQPRNKPVMTPEGSAAISAGVSKAMKERWKDPEFSARQRAAISVANRRRWAKFREERAANGEV